MSEDAPMTKALLHHPHTLFLWVELNLLDHIVTLVLPCSIKAFAAPGCALSLHSCPPTSPDLSRPRGHTAQIFPAPAAGHRKILLHTVIFS